MRWCQADMPESLNAVRRKGSKAIEADRCVARGVGAGRMEAEFVANLRLSEKLLVRASAHEDQSIRRAIVN